MKFLNQQLTDLIEIVHVAQGQLERNQLGLTHDNLLNAQKKLNEIFVRFHKIREPVEEPPLQYGKKPLSMGNQVSLDEEPTGYQRQSSEMERTQIKEPVGMIESLTGGLFKGWF